MNRCSVALLSILLLGFNLVSCSNITNETVKNQNSQVVKFKKFNQQQDLPQRVITLTPLAANLIYNLDASKLVAIPNSRDTKKKPQFTNYPKVSLYSNVNLEKVIALKPDLAIGSEVMHSEALAKLKKLGVDIISQEIRSWEDLTNFTQKLAVRIGANPQPILDKYQSCVDNIPKNGKSVLVLTGRIPTSSPNKNSWTGDLLNKFNYQNLTADFQSNRPFSGYLNLSQEKILTANPDLIFLVESDNLNPNVLKKLPFWKNLKATQKDQVYIFHHDGLITPTSLETITEVCRKLRQLAR
ncbi:MAG: ABC transporter substrate-binding protein [Mastigocoleus sp. MO_167.B18]|nr:ABC transporter substrate-binding protein [Mastigocoleus sp. MO_167.B18]